MAKYGSYVLSYLIIILLTACTDKKSKIIGTTNANFVGKYTCHGFDPYLNENYTGMVEITQNNTVYNLNMKYSTGEDMVGTGGQYSEQLLFVAFQDTQDLKKVGLEQYEAKEGNKIAGYWVYLKGDKLGTEICEKV